MATIEGNSHLGCWLLWFPGPPLGMQVAWLCGEGGFEEDGDKKLVEDGAWGGRRLDDGSREVPI